MKAKPADQHDAMDKNQLGLVCCESKGQQVGGSLQPAFHEEVAQDDDYSLITAIIQNLTRSFVPVYHHRHSYLSPWKWAHSTFIYCYTKLLLNYGEHGNKYSFPFH